MTLNKLADPPVETRNGTLTGAAANNTLIAQFISPPISAQTISGTLTIVMAGLEADTADNIDQYGYRAIVTDSTGTVVRGTLKALTVATVAELATSKSAILVVNAVALSSVAALDGDRIVVEFGLGESGIGTTPVWQAFVGGTGTDYPATNLSTAGNVPWIEFSGAITFQAAVTATPVTTPFRNYTYITANSPGSAYLSLFRLKAGESLTTFINNWTQGNRGDYPQGLVRPQGVVDPVKGWATQTSNGWAYWVDNEVPLDVPVKYVAYDLTNNIQFVQGSSQSVATSATITRVAAGTLTEQGTGGTTSFVVNYPATVVAGEMLIAAIGAGGGVVSTPVGWNLIGGSNQAAADSAYGFWRLAAGTEGGTTVTFTLATAGRATAVITRYTGVDPVSPLDTAATTGQNTGVGSTVTIASLNTVTDGAYMVSGACGNAATGPPVWTVPAGFSGLVQSTGTGKGAAYADGLVITPPGATGTKVWSWTSTGVAQDAWMAALRPVVTIVTITPPTYLTTANAYWLRDPQNPALDLPLHNTTPNTGDCLPVDGVYFASMGDENYTSQAVVQPIDDSAYPVVAAQPRAARASTLTVVARTFDSRDALLKLLASGNPLLFQAPAQYGIPDTYMAVLDVPVQRPLSDHRRQWRMLALSFGPSLRPVGVSSGGPGQRWIDTKNPTFPYNTWADVTAANITTQQLLVLQF